MARSELDKLLAATNTKGGTGSGRNDFTRFMAEVLRLTRAPKAVRVADTAPRRLTTPKALKPENTVPSRLLKVAPVAPAPSSVSPVLPRASSDLGRLAAQTDQLRRLMTPAAAPAAVKAKASSRSAMPASSGTNSIVKFVSNFLGGSGLGSIVSELAGLFGGGTPEAPPPLYQFALPHSVSVEAGVTRNGQFVPVSHSQNGTVRADTAPQPVTQTAAQPLMVDSRWFMDHSEDIASAVKEAMLHSHSINDVVADL